MDPNVSPTELFRMQLEKRLFERRNDLEVLKRQNRKSLIVLIVQVVIAIGLSILIQYVKSNKNIVVSFSVVIYLLCGLEIIVLIFAIIGLLRFLGNQGFPLFSRIFFRGIQYSNSFLQREAKHDIARLIRKLNELD